jgi:hypothetical protein
VLRARAHARPAGDAGYVELDELELPGAGELELLCENARAVASLCDLLRIRPATVRGRRLIQEPELVELDGSWILPEEV